MVSMLSWCAACIVASALFVLAKRLNYIRLRRELQCEEPPQYAHIDPIIGLDLVYKIIKAIKGDTFLPMTQAIYEQSGMTFQAIGWGNRVIHTVDPENIKAIFVTDFAKWGVAPSRLSPLEAFFGKGILTVDGILWHRSRKLLLSSLEKSAVANLAPMESFAADVLAVIPRDGSTIDMQPLLSAKFIPATTQFLFGEDRSELPESVTAMDIVRDFDEGLSGGYLRVALGPLRYLGYTSKWLGACKRTQQFADAYVDQALKLRNDFKDGNAQHKLSRNILLHNLAQQTDDRLQMRNNIIHAFAASRETTVNLMTKVLFVASRSPEMWSQLREEALAIIPMGTSPTYEQLKRLVYMRNLINEVLRLYPLLPNLVRTALVDTTLPTGGGPSAKSPIFVPAGTNVDVSVYTMHRHPEVWGKDAAEFRAERWDTTSDTYSRYLPFGLGPRNCPGRDKAVTEAAFVLVKLLHRYSRLESRDSREWRGHIAITAENLYGCKVAFLE